ncbi:hypothetical protein [Williamsia phyllosphaerae]|uniref:hypothetical protein n=1 Tax=Williamsia phyllosphaerae TaxID=885042 RepID=UPI001668F4D8|nr:hypothetical protein [Williamsia phyllosphaerae]
MASMVMVLVTGAAFATAGVARPMPPATTAAAAAMAPMRARVDVLVVDEFMLSPCDVGEH